jgi:CDP-glucose 4,6-dehydratase
MTNREWEGRTALVTGASGLIGSWLVQRLIAEGATVVALVQDDDPHTELVRSGAILGARVVSGELESYRDIERAIQREETDTVFHLGAQTLVGSAHRAPLATFESNIRGTYNLLEACRTSGGVVQRVIVASSDKAYGTQAVLPYTEDTPLEGREPYAVSKTCTDLIAQTYAHTYGLPVAIARCGNVYGGGDLNWSRIVPGTIRSLFEKRSPVIRSDGTYLRDYIYVEDVVDGYLAIASALDGRSGPGRAYNISTEEALTVIELVDEIRRLMGCEQIPLDIRGTAKGEIHDQHLSAERARRELGWAPRFGLSNGLAATIRWYGDYLEVPSEG